MHDRGAIAEMALRFRNNARSSLPRAPLNAAISDIVADRPELSALLLAAPAEQRNPVLLLAAVHDLVLRDPTSALAEWYGSVSADPRSPGDPRLADRFRAFVSARDAELRHLLETRRTQTNEVGRCSLYLLALAGAEGPLAHLDAGASGGLNLLLDRYEYHYAPGGTVGGPSPVAIRTDIRGTGVVPTAIPTIAARCGIDVSPVDVTDPDAARWLEACCWPDQRDRFQRLHAAIRIARSDPPELLAGDIVDSVGPAIGRLAHRGHPVVTTSWVLNYLTPHQRTAFVAELDAAATRTDLTWVLVESPHVTAELPWPEPVDRPELTHLARVDWRGGERTVRVLARCHPHGYWAHRLDG